MLTLVYNIHIYVYTIDCRSVYQRRRQLRQDRASIQRVYHFGVALDLIVFSLQAFFSSKSFIRGDVNLQEYPYCGAWQRIGNAMSFDRRVAGSNPALVAT